MTYYDAIVILVGVAGERKHPDDGPGEWYSAYLIYGNGNNHIEAFGGSPKEAASFAIDIWERRKEVRDGTQAGGTQPPAGSQAVEIMEKPR